MTVALPTLDQVEVKGRTVLVRSDLNVPMEGGRITDRTRIVRLLPTFKELMEKNARVVVLSHFGRPEGTFVPSMSLAPLVDALSAELKTEVKFGVDCVGTAVREAVSRIQPGQIVLLENLRFHGEEETNNIEFAKDLASLGELYVNDAFSCSHRAHASIVGIPHHLPFAAGRLLEQEVKALGGIFSAPVRPLAAIVGGVKVSTKLQLLENLIGKVDVLVIGGAMANTFLHARGVKVGASLHEPGLGKTARAILEKAAGAGCDIVLPEDVVVADALSAQSECTICALDSIPPKGMIVDVGPQTIARYLEKLAACRMIVWNGPVGAFETSPFDASTVQLARILAALTRSGQAQTIAGGGDTVAAVGHAGVIQALTYLSTAGGAFLEWLEGKTLPGIAALQNPPIPDSRALANG